jgi:4-diphosphocytidyl-2-C-methyl-D-erythritol kinase
MPTRVRSHAKINLGLGIGAPRPDGFHGLTTAYQTLEIYDEVTVTASPAASTSIRLTSNHLGVPTDSRNTAWKMISLALDELRVTADISIHIEKLLPVQGGLGAGSANAVAALIGLEHEFGISETKGQPGAPSMGRILSDGWETTNPNPRQIPKDWPTCRLNLAARVGSDVPLFLIGGTILGLDRGQQVHPLPDLEQLWCVLAIPAEGVSTPQAFRDWDALCAAQGLTQEASADKLNRLSRAYLSAFGAKIPGDGQSSSGVFPNGEDLAGPQESALVRTGITSWIENDFERVVFPQHPSLAEIKRLLAAPQTPEAALYAALSGSGSALLGLYPTRGDAEAAQDRVKKSFRESQVRTVVTRTLPRAQYWRQMILG